MHILRVIRTQIFSPSLLKEAAANIICIYVRLLYIREGYWGAAEAASITLYFFACGCLPQNQITRNVYLVGRQFTRQASHFENSHKLNSYDRIGRLFSQKAKKKKKVIGEKRQDWK